MKYLALIPLLPLLGFLFNFTIGIRVLGRKASGHGHAHDAHGGHDTHAAHAPHPLIGLVACGAVALSFLVAVYAVVQAHNSPDHAVVQILWTWLPGGLGETAVHGTPGATAFQVDWAYAVDPLSSVMLLVVTFVGFLIHVYSIGYMSHDPGYARYMSYLNLFMFAMLNLVLGANYPVLFVGWEGVGLCSYLLIGFWFHKDSAADAGKKAFIVNRIGDAGFMLGMFLIFHTFGSLDFRTVMAAAAHLPVETTGIGTLTLISLFLFIGAMGKSAQLPLYVWLPDAIEGPTPVSALIHAATMVTAGVYMIGRNAELFSHAPTTLAVVSGIGAATALMAGTIGLVQNDIKRVLAYSTVSQLGYMFLAMGVGAYAAGIFHLYTHAFFKALLFLGSGAVIHALAGEQDLRNMGGLRKHLPITYWTFLVGALAIAGVPLLSGFFSKDEILFRTFTSSHPYRWLLWGIGAVTSLLTATYMFRLVFLAFHGERHAGDQHAGDHPEEAEPVRHPNYVQAAPHAGHQPGSHGHAPHDAPPSMAIPLIVLAIGSIVAGYVGVPHALGGSNRIERFLEPSFEVSEGARPLALQESDPPHAAGEAGSGESTELMLMALSSGIAFAGIAIAAYFWLRNRAAADAMSRRMHGLYNLLCHKYYVDEMYDAAIVQPIKLVSTGGLWKGIDAGLIDGAVNGVGQSVRAGSGALRRLQTGSVRTYAASLFLGVVLILGWYLLKF